MQILWLLRHQNKVRTLARNNQKPMNDVCHSLLLHPTIFAPLRWYSLFRLIMHPDFVGKVQSGAFDDPINIWLCTVYIVHCTTNALSYKLIWWNDNILASIWIRDLFSLSLYCLSLYVCLFGANHSALPTGTIGGHA